ncbi:MAG: isopeptide-forming domain-containing fimbrial protein, partial [Coriobacteriia bacterium]|nr:isopeptide-forming domain-containing fimbrial protein [Coriobacteriia bacterium]
MLKNKRTVTASTKFKVTAAFVALFLLTLPLLTVASSETELDAGLTQAAQQVQQPEYAQSINQEGLLEDAPAAPVDESAIEDAPAASAVDVDDDAVELLGPPHAAELIGEIAPSPFSGLVPDGSFFVPRVKDWDNIEFLNPSFEEPFVHVMPPLSPGGGRSSSPMSHDRPGTRPIIATYGGTDTVSTGTGALRYNGMFADPKNGARNSRWQTMRQEVVPGWNTIAVAPAQRTLPQADYIDFVWEGLTPIGPSFTPHSGLQAAELSGSVPSILYQDANTTPGMTVYYEFFHRGRSGVGPAQQDRLDFFLYDPTDPAIAAVNDGFPVHVSGPIGTNPVFDPPAQDFSEQDRTAWARVAGVFTIPAGQDITRFAFQGTRAHGGTLVMGNLLDDIRLMTPSFLEVEKTSLNTPSNQVQPGQRVTYSIVIRNIGEADASQTVLTDVLHSNLSFVPGSVTINGQSAAGFYNFNAGTRTLTVNVGEDSRVGPDTTTSGIIEGSRVVAGQTVYDYVTVTFQADVNTDTTAGTVIQNQAHVSFDDYLFEQYTDGGYENVSPVHSLEVRQRSIRGTVWLDANQNGLLDAGEERLAGITVSLETTPGTPALDIAGNPMAPVTTDANGVFTFVGMPAGNFRIVAQLPAEHRVVPVQMPGGNQANQSGTTAVIGSVAPSAPWTTMPSEGTANRIGIVPIPPAESALTKVLHTPVDQPAPNLNFTFEVRPYAFLDSYGTPDPTNLWRLPRIGDQAPPPAAAGVGHRTFNINADNADVTVTGSTRTLRLDIDLLGGIDLRSADIIPGIYIWHISEVEDSSGVNALAGRSSVNYSPAVYELRIVITGTFPNQILEVTSSAIVLDTGGDFGAPLFSWGLNTTGQLGTGASGGTHDAPRPRQYVNVPGGSPVQQLRENWVEVATAAGGSMAINSDGHLYVWGAPRNSDRMGRPDSADSANITRPERLFMPAPAPGEPTELEKIAAGGEAHRWVAVDASGAADGGRMFAINDQGEVWAWGANGRGQLGRGVPGTANTSDTRSPVRVATHLPSNWVDVSTVSITTGSRHFTFLINENGHIYSAGDNSDSNLGRTASNAAGGAAARSTFTRINASAGSAALNAPAGVTQWHTMRAGANSVAVSICRCCRSLYSWGLNNESNTVTASGTGARAGGTTDIPTPVDVSGIAGGTNLRWADVICQIENRTWVALTECGRLFSWRGGTTSTAGVGLGRTGGGGAGSATDNRRPREVGAGRTWIGLGGGNQHSFAMTADGILFGWGNGADGRLGTGDNPLIPANQSQATPVQILQTTGLQAFSQTGSGNHSMALVRTDPMTFTNVYNRVTPDPVTARADLTKALQKPADLTTSNLSFDFNIERYSFNGETSRAAEIPQLGTSVVSGVGRVSIDMNHSSTTVETSGAVSTLLRSIDILDGVEFTDPGVFVWRITEVANSSGVSAPSTVIYSQAEYKLTVTVTEVARTLFITTVIEEVTPDNGFELSSAAQRDSFPLYSWGADTSGRLARTVTAESPSDLPARATHSENWVYVAGSATAAYAINTNGELFSWGAPWSEYQMGQGGVNLGIPPNTPAQVGEADNWMQVSARVGQASAINENGELFRWGQGGFNVPTPVEVGTTFASVSQGNTRLLAICSDGYLFRSTTAAATDITLEQVGTRNDWSVISARSDSAFPFFPTWQGVTESGQLWDIPLTGTETQVGTATNWVDVRTTNSSSAAITTAGHLYTWGVAAELGRPNDGTGGPGRVGTDNNWVSVHGGNNYFLAFNALGELWAWGSNFSGQLGLGDDTHRD